MLSMFCIRAEDDKIWPLSFFEQKIHFFKNSKLHLHLGFVQIANNSKEETDGHVKMFTQILYLIKKTKFLIKLNSLTKYSQIRL